MTDQMLFIILAIIFSGLGIWFAHTRGNTILQDWADVNGLQILRKEFRYFRQGPFWWRTGNGRVVYFVTVRDEQGRQRSGWVRCGSWLGGLLSDKADVIWKD